MLTQQASNYVKNEILYIVGIIVLIFSLIGFGLYVILNTYSITHKNNGSVEENFNITTGSIDYIQSEHPDAIVERLDKGFPLKSTFILLVASAIIWRSRLRHRTDEKFVQLRKLLQKNKKVKLSHLSTKIGVDKVFILQALPEINKHRGASFSYQLENDMIVDNASTIDWHLNNKCGNCGAVADVMLTVAIENESLSCPYCSGEISDPEFEKARDVARARSESGNAVFVSRVMNYLDLPRI